MVHGVCVAKQLSSSVSSAVLVALIGFFSFLSPFFSVTILCSWKSGSQSHFAFLLKNPTTLSQEVKEEQVWSQSEAASGIACRKKMFLLFSELPSIQDSKIPALQGLFFKLLL